MTRLEELEKSIASLPKAELDQLANRFDELRATQWDAQIELDGDNISLIDLADSAVRDHQAGQTTAL